MNESTVLQNIKKIRGLKNYKPEFIAGELDLSPRAYSKIESGETALAFNRFFRIATILEIKPEELIGFDYKSIFNNCQKSGNNNTYHFDQNMIKELLNSKDEINGILKDQNTALKGENAILKQEIERFKSSIDLAK